MAFENNLCGIRALGRNIILPSKEIKKLIKEELFCKYSIHKVIDFGAGTLYWSNWFLEMLVEKKRGGRRRLSCGYYIWKKYAGYKHDMLFFNG